MNVKQKRILTVLLLISSVLFVVIFVSTVSFTFVPNGGGNGGDLPVAPVLEEIIPSVSTDGTVNLDWNDVSGADRYAVYRSKDSGSFIVLTYFASVSYYNDLILYSGTYTYKVTAGNVDGDYSVFSNTESVTVQIFPVAPELDPISPTTDTDGSIALSWNSVSDATIYKVFVSKDGGAWVSVINTEATSIVHQISVNGNYNFGVKASNAVGDSVFSNFQSVVVNIPEEEELEIPDAPDLRLMVNSPSIDGEIRLEWDSVSGATMYTIYRCKEGGISQILKQDFGENYYDDFVSSNGVYSYKVKAGNSEKEYSEYSNEVSVTVQIPEVPDVPVMNQLEFEIIGDTTKVYIDWDAVDCDSYVLYRSFDGEIYKPVEGGVHSATGYTEILTEAGTYIYEVSAVNTHGESERSNSVTIKLVEGGGVAPDYIILYVLLVILGVLIVPIAIILVKRKKR